MVTPPLPERDFDPSNIPASSATSSPTLAPSSQGSSPPLTPDHLKNNHISLDYSLYSNPSVLNSEAPVEEFLLPKALSTSSVKTSTALLQELGSPLEWMAEILFVLRPLIYGKPSLTY